MWQEPGLILPGKSCVGGIAGAGSGDSCFGGDWIKPPVCVPQCGIIPAAPQGAAPWAVWGVGAQAEGKSWEFGTGQSWAPVLGC